MGDVKSELSAAVLVIDDYFAVHGLPLFIKGATVDIVSFLARYWPNRFVFSPDRNSFEYVYLSQDLINLTGRKYSSQRGHVNHFKRVYPHFEYIPMSNELVPALLAVGKSSRHTSQQARMAVDTAEMHALEEAVLHWADLKLSGGAILIENRVEAFSLGESLNDDTFVVHIEKANPRIRGICQTINNELCRTYCASKKYVNRAEDMGIAGIRAARTAYRPIGYVPKIKAIAKSKLL